MGVVMEPVDSFLASYAAAVWGRDLDGFMRLYADAVVVFDAWEHTEYRGRDAWAPVIGQWSSSLNDEKVEVAFNDVQAVNGTVRRGGGRSRTSIPPCRSTRRRARPSLVPRRCAART